MDIHDNKTNDRWREEEVPSALGQADAGQSICRDMQPRKETTEVEYRSL